MKIIPHTCFLTLNSIRENTVEKVQIVFKTAVYVVLHEIVLKILLSEIPEFSSQK